MSDTIVDVDAAQRMMGVLLNPALFKKEKKEGTTKLQWVQVALAGVYVGHRLVPLFKKVPAEKQVTLIREYEAMVSNYTPEQVATFFRHDEPAMKKKLMFYVALVKLALSKVIEDEAPS